MKRILMSCLLLGGFMMLFSDCRKPTVIGDELIPDEDQLNSARTDTFAVITYTVPDDSAVTSRNLFYSLGSLDQADYGKTTANIYAQINLPTNNLTFGTGAVADSAVLILDYAALYGDTTAQHKLTVYKLLEPLYTTKDYYSDARFTELPVALGKKDFFTPNLKDSINSYDLRLQPHLRIKLSQKFAADLVGLDSVNLVDDAAFQDYFQGLFIEEDVSSGYSNSMMIFDLSSSISGINVYFHNDEFDSLTATFPMKGAKVNRFTHDHTGSRSEPFVTSPNTVTGDSVTFVQGFTGLKTVVKLPTLTNLQGVSINKAELVFSVDGPLDTLTYTAPPRTVLLAADSLGHNSFIFDYTQEQYYSVLDQFRNGFDYGGGLVYATNHLGNLQHEYKFDITLEVQKLLEGDLTNRGFTLLTYPGYRIPNGVVLGGTTNENLNLKPYLSVTYTYVNQ